MLQLSKTKVKLILAFLCAKDK